MTIEVTLKPIDWLKPYEKNAKKHPEVEVKRLAATIKRFGWDQPIVAEADGTIIKGHGRRLAAISLGMTEVPVWVRHDLTKTEADAARIADNAAVGTGYDTAMIQDELRRIMADLDANISFDDLALTEKDRTLLLAQLDEANKDAILIDGIMDNEAERQEESERIDTTDGEMVPMSKVLGFTRIPRGAERVISGFMAEAEAATGKTGAEAFLAGLKLAADRGLV